MSSKRKSFEKRFHRSTKEFLVEKKKFVSLIKEVLVCRIFFCDDVQQKIIDIQARMSLRSGKKREVQKPKTAEERQKFREDSKCPLSKQRRLGDNTCLDVKVLRQIMKKFQQVAAEEEEESAVSFRPYSKKGGVNQNHDHRKKAGLYATIKETLNQADETLWSNERVAPENKYWQALTRQSDAESKSLTNVLKDEYFKPELPAHNFTQSWLTSITMERAAWQAVQPIKTFAFLGVGRPEVRELKMLIMDFQLARKQGRAKSYGAIFNTDEARGNHWVTVLFWPEQKKYEYFDSMNLPVNAQLGCAIRVLKQHIAQTYGFSNLEWNHPVVKRVRHQKGGVQCGMYAIWYLWQRITKKVTLSAIHSRSVGDDEMANLRKLFFRREAGAAGSASAKRESVPSDHDDDNDKDDEDDDDLQILEAWTERKSVAEKPKRSARANRIQLFFDPKPKGYQDKNGQKTDLFDETKCGPYRLIVNDP